MKTNKRLNCYVFSNLIISFLSLNLLVNDSATTLNMINNDSGNTLNKIYEIKKDSVVNTTNVVTTISVTKKSVQTKSNITYIKPSYNSVTGNSLVNYAKHYLGLKYVHGGNSLTNGTDCSGFTKLIYKEFGISLGRTVNSQIYSGTYVSKSDLEPGDLVFYGYSSNKATHVGIYMGSGLVIHQSNPSDGVKINSVNMMVYITARRVITANIERVVEVPNDNKIEDEKKEEVKEEINNNIDDNINNSVNDNTSDTKVEDYNTTEQVPSEVIDDTKEEVVQEIIVPDSVVDIQPEIEVEIESDAEIKTEVIEENESLSETEVSGDTNELVKSEEVITDENVDSSVTSINIVE